MSYLEKSLRGIVVCCLVGTEIYLYVYSPPLDNMANTPIWLFEINSFVSYFGFAVIIHTTLLLGT